MAERNQRKSRTGIVVSDKAQKTVIVNVARNTKHGKYEKTMRRSSRFAAHDEKNESHVGDMVRIVETRPLSKTKRWRVVEIVTRAR